MNPKRSKVTILFAVSALAAVVFGLLLNYYSSRVQSLWVPREVVRDDLRRMKMRANACLLLFLFSGGLVVISLVTAILNRRRNRRG